MSFSGTSVLVTFIKDVTQKPHKGRRARDKGGRRLNGLDTAAWEEAMSWRPT